VAKLLRLTCPWGCDLSELCTSLSNFTTKRNDHNSEIEFLIENHLVRTSQLMPQGVKDENDKFSVSHTTCHVIVTSLQHTGTITIFVTL